MGASARSVAAAHLTRRAADVGQRIEGLREALGLVREGDASALNAPWTYALSPANARRVRGLAVAVVRAERLLDRGDVAGATATLDDVDGDIRWMTRVRSKTPDAVEVDGFKVIVMPQADPKSVPGMLDALREAARLVRPHFPEVLYGDVYLANVVSSGLAHYLPDADVMNVGGKAREVGLVHAICHELGHRYEHKFWKDTDQQAAFRDLSYPRAVPKYLEFDERTRESFADEVQAAVVAMRRGKNTRASKDLNGFLGHRDRVDLQRLLQAALKGGPDEERALRAFVVGPPGVLRIRDGLDRVEPVLASRRGGVSASENFAEAFALFVAGQRLPPELQAIMEVLD